MNRIPPSEKIRKQIKTLLSGDWEAVKNLVSKFTFLGSQLLAQESLEQEVIDYLVNIGLECPLFIGLLRPGILRLACGEGAYRAVLPLLDPIPGRLSKHPTRFRLLHSYR